MKYLTNVTSAEKAGMALVANFSHVAATKRLRHPWFALVMLMELARELVSPSKSVCSQFLVFMHSYGTHSYICRGWYLQGLLGRLGKDCAGRHWKKWFCSHAPCRSHSSAMPLVDCGKSCVWWHSQGGHLWMYDKSRWRSLQCEWMCKLQGMLGRWRQRSWWGPILPGIFTLVISLVSQFLTWPCKKLL